MAMSQGTVLWVSATTCAVSCWQTLDAEVLNPALWLSWRHIFPPGYLLQAWAKALWQDAESEASQGCFLTQQDKKMYLSDEGQGADAMLTYPEYMTCLQLCPGIWKGDFIPVMRSVWRTEPLLYIPALSCYRCSNPVIQSRRRFMPCHWHHYVLTTLWDWWQELKRIIHSPSSCQRGCPLQSSRSGSLAHGRMRLPGQQCPQLRAMSARTAVSSAAGLASSSPSSPGHLQFNILGDKKHKQVYSRGQSGHENTVSLLKTEITCASARGCSNYVSQ